MMQARQPICRLLDGSRLSGDPSTQANDVMHSAAAIIQKFAATKHKNFCFRGRIA
jgi:hypothetical protein